MKINAVLLSFFTIATVTFALEYHVSVDGDNSYSGTISKPFKTISKASEIAQPGDIITVHQGLYREQISPFRGGTGDDSRIVYQAADGEKVVIKGSEAVKGWENTEGDVWKITLPNSFFPSYNPYKDEITGDWFNGRGRVHHTGEVYLNGRSFFEKSSLDEVLKPQPYEHAIDKDASIYTWYCQSDDTTTTIWANFHGANPNDELVEINVRPSCFYPAKTGCNYITVRGFTMMHAATQWAAPTAEQIGLIGTFWSKGWIIENNTISDSKCVGITLGKDRKTGHNVASKNPRKGGDVHYNEVIFRALDAGWSKENIGSHIVRNNVIYNCEAAGICGSLGAIFSEISGNHIYNIQRKLQYIGAETAGIKIHAAIDTLIKNNHVHNCDRAIWLDWMAQGSQITANLCYENFRVDLFMEMNHGPFIADNNLFLSPISLQDWSSGGAYVHNLFAGGIIHHRENDYRHTPYLKAHSTEVAGMYPLAEGGNRFYNNIFCNQGLDIYNNPKLPMHVEGNVYFNQAKPYEKEVNAAEYSDVESNVKLTLLDNAYILTHTMKQEQFNNKTRLVNTCMLGIAEVPELPFENSDSTNIEIDYDYYGNPRNTELPTAGPFENIVESFRLMPAK